MSQKKLSSDFDKNALKLVKYNDTYEVLLVCGEAFHKK